MPLLGLLGLFNLSIDVVLAFRCITEPTYLGTCRIAYFALLCFVLLALLALLTYFGSK